MRDEPNYDFLAQGLLMLAKQERWNEDNIVTQAGHALHQAQESYDVIWDTAWKAGHDRRTEELEQALEQARDMARNAASWRDSNEEKLRLSESELEQVIETLWFYADPETYFAIGFFPDPPAGEFMDDFDEQPGLGRKPGKRARATLNRIAEDS